MPQFLGLCTATTWAANGGVPAREIARHALKACRAQRTVENPDQNRLELGVRRNWDGLSALTPRTIVWVVKSDGSFDEWRLNTNDKANLAPGSGIKQFSALPPVYMLAECGEYFTTGAGGVRDYSYSQLGTTATAAFNSLVLGTPGIPGFVGLGTVDAAIDAVPIDVESTDEGKTPLAILLQIVDAVRSKDVPCEWEYVRVGTTGYVVNLRTSVGASATVPVFEAGKNVIDYLLKYNCTQQTTRVRPKGPVDATGLAARLSRARYKVTAVNGGTKRVTVADEAGGAGPIRYDDQYVGWFGFREKTGRTFQILHSYKATQELEFADVSTMAAHSVTAPEWLSFRESEPLTGTRRWGADASAIVSPYKARWAEVTAVGAGTLTLTDNWGVGDPITADNRFIDWRLRRASLVLATSFTMNVTAGRLDCASVTGVQAGDIVVIGSAAAAPYGSGGLGSAPGTTMAVVSSVDAVNKYLFVTIRYAGTWQLTATTFYARVFRTVATQHMVSASVAATNVVTVDAVGTAAATDLVEIIQPCQGVLPTYIDSPADLAAYGVKISRLDVDDTGECNQIPNPVMRTWPGSASAPPDGWTWSGTGAATIARTSDPAYTLQGGYSAYCVLLSGATAGVLTTPPAYVHPIVGADLDALRLRLFITDFPAGAEWDPTFTYTYAVQSQIHVKLYKRSATGSLTQIGTTVIFGSPGAGFSNPTTLNAWVDAVFDGADISTLTDETLVATVSAVWNGSIPGGSIKAYVDGAQLTQTPTPPRPAPELLIEYAEGNKLLQRANAELIEWASPPKEFTGKLADFARVDPTKYSADAITLGGSLRLVHADESVDETVRCLSLGEDYLEEANTDVTIAVLPTRFTSLVALGSAA